jgi:hypothetical protein
MLDFLTRRQFLRAGALGALSLADVLRLQAAAPPGSPRRSVIYVVLDGGPSHLDMWDPKPDSPAEYRGPFRPIPTRLPGVRFSELMPLQAARMDRLSLIRGMKSVENDHFLSEVYTGLPRTAGKRPAFGSLVSRLRGGDSPLPAYVSLDRETVEQFEYEKPHYAGANHAPFRPFGDGLDNLRAVKDLGRLRDRRSLLAAFDGLRRDLDQKDGFHGLDQFTAQAMDILTSPKVREAFDLSREPTKVVERYGSGKVLHQTVKTIEYPWSGKPFLLARRLVEAGVRVVTLKAGSWDHHSGPEADIFLALRRMVPLLDQALCALIDDLRDRGLADDVLVVCLGEFGRTPKITPLGPGREHWADAGCVVLAGGGLMTGRVVGETDGKGERDRGRPVSFQNLFATIYRTLSIDPATRVTDFAGRPQHLLEDRDPIAGL